MRISRYALLALLSSLCYISKAQVPDEHASVEVLVLCAPTPVRAEGKFHLVYELHITNFSEKDVTLTRVDVLGDKSTAPITTYEGAQLAEQLSTPGRMTPEKARLGGGQRLIVFIWATLNPAEAIPATVRHRLTFVRASGRDHPAEMSIEAGETPVRQEQAIAIQPPLKGGDWLALGGPSNSSKHRRAVMAVDGKTRDAQRFAVDWNKIGPGGEEWKGNPQKNASYYSYGSEVLAVAKGTVLEAVDNLPDHPPGRPHPCTFETCLGNHIVLDLGTGHYAFYAHMQLGKVRVHRGDRVEAGQVLGLLGDSGNATGPHLHFHLMDSPSPLESEGLPYIFNSFESDGHKRAMEMPLENMVVRFPESR